MQFQWNLQVIARQRGILSSGQLAERARLAPNTATSLWHGRPLQIHLPTMARVCAALHCTLDDLLILQAEAQPVDRASLAAIPVEVDEALR
jgi:DNA-binding Xre family transcriptional regulator